MNWKPIEQYDNLKVKPKLCVFYFAAENRPRNNLPATIEMQRHYGHRVCTHYIELPPLPADGEQS